MRILLPWPWCLLVCSLVMACGKKSSTPPPIHVNVADSDVKSMLFSNEIAASDGSRQRIVVVSTLAGLCDKLTAKESYTENSREIYRTIVLSQPGSATLTPGKYPTSLNLDPNTQSSTFNGDVYFESGDCLGIVARSVPRGSVSTGEIDLDTLTDSGMTLSVDVNGRDVTWSGSVQATLCPGLDTAQALDKNHCAATAQ